MHSGERRSPVVHCAFMPYPHALSEAEMSTWRGASGGFKKIAQNGCKSLLALCVCLGAPGERSPQSDQAPHLIIWGVHPCSPLFIFHDVKIPLSMPGEDPGPGLRSGLNFVSRNGIFLSFYLPIKR